MMQIEGRQQVLVGLRRNKVERILLADSAHGNVIDEIVSLACENQVDLRYVPKEDIESKSKVRNNQGVIAYLRNWDYTNLDDLLAQSKKEKSPLILILDHLQDPHNLGAIMRSADATGVSGVIIPKDRSVKMTETVVKISAGAALTVPLTMVTNLSQTIDVLKDEGFWIMGTDADTDDYIYDKNLQMPLALIIGSEGKGISNNLAKKSDFLVKLPMEGTITSLNASVAAGVMMYEILRQRQFDS
jgi:23S rRNA (guanosine2251-2'-O)-methyltransferase